MALRIQLLALFLSSPVGGAVPKSSSCPCLTSLCWGTSSSESSLETSHTDDKVDITEEIPRSDTEEIPRSDTEQIPRIDPDGVADDASFTPATNIGSTLTNTSKPFEQDDTHSHNWFDINFGCQTTETVSNLNVVFVGTAIIDANYFPDDVGTDGTGKRKSGIDEKKKEMDKPMYQILSDPFEQYIKYWEKAGVSPDLREISELASAKTDEL